MLQRRVELPVDAPQLSTLADLAAYVEPEARLRLVDGDTTRALADRIALAAGRMLRRHAPVVHHRHGGGRAPSRGTVLAVLMGWQALHLRLAVRHLALWPPIHSGRRRTALSDIVPWRFIRARVSRSLYMCVCEEYRRWEYREMGEGTSTS